MTQDVTVLTTEEEITDALSEGQKGTIFVKETPFYATSGGQEADTGYIRTAEGEFKVEDTVKLLGGKIGHIGVMTKGMIKAGDKVTLEVDAKKRCAFRKKPQCNSSASESAAYGSGDSCGAGRIQRQ